MPTRSCLAAPPCTQVLPIVCKRKSLPSRHLPSRSRSLRHLRENTPSGLEVLSWLLCPHSSRCGSPSRNMMNPDLALCTANASKSFNHERLMNALAQEQSHKTSNNNNRNNISTFKHLECQQDIVLKANETTKSEFMAQSRTSVTTTQKALLTTRIKRSLQLYWEGNSNFKQINNNTAKAHNGNYMPLLICDICRNFLCITLWLHVKFQINFYFRI